MTLNRLLTTAVQVAISLPLIWYVREVYREWRKSH
jgi:hypothetical protein